MKRYLLTSVSIMILKPLHPLAVNRILVQAALRLGIVPAKR